MDDFPRAAQKYRSKDASIVVGGCAANAAIAIARLGGKTGLACRLGDDEIGRLIGAGLAKNKVDCSLVRCFENHRSSFSSIYVDATGERQIVNSRDLSLSFDADWLIDAMPNFSVGLADTRWPQGAAAVMRAARTRGVVGILDAEAPIEEAQEALHLASHVAFSREGLEDFGGQGSIEELLLSADEKLDGTVLVTDGGNGAFWVENHNICHQPAFSLTVIDTLAAGDVWHGALALQLARGEALSSAVHFANAAAALKCTRKGGGDGAPTLSEVEEFLQKQGD